MRARSQRWLASPDGCRRTAGGGRSASRNWAMQYWPRALIFRCMGIPRLHGQCSQWATMGLPIPDKTHRAAAALASRRASRGHEHRRCRRTPEDAGADGRSLEAEDWSRLGAGVRARAVCALFAPDRPAGTEPMDALGVAPVARPNRQPRTYTPPMRRFAEQASRPAAGLCRADPAIVVPVWLDHAPAIAQVTAQTASLDVSVPQSAHSDAGSDAALVASVVASCPVAVAAGRVRVGAEIGRAVGCRITGRAMAACESGILDAGQREYPLRRPGWSRLTGNASAVPKSAGTAQPGISGPSPRERGALYGILRRASPTRGRLSAAAFAGRSSRCPDGAATHGRP